MNINLDDPLFANSFEQLQQLPCFSPQENKLQKYEELDKQENKEKWELAKTAFLNQIFIKLESTSQNIMLFRSEERIITINWKNRIIYLIEALFFTIITFSIGIANQNVQNLYSNFWYGKGYLVIRTCYSPYPVSTQTNLKNIVDAYIEQTLTHGHYRKVSNYSHLYSNTNQLNGLNGFVENRNALISSIEKGEPTAASWNNYSESASTIRSYTFSSSILSLHRPINNQQSNEKKALLKSICQGNSDDAVWLAYVNGMQQQVQRLQ